MGAEIPTPSCCECDEEDKIIKNLLETSSNLNDIKIANF